MMVKGKASKHYDGARVVCGIESDFKVVKNARK